MNNQPSNVSSGSAPTLTLARSPRHQRGFTLLELIVVIALIGILASMAMVSLRSRPKATKEAVLKTNLLAMRQTLDEFHADKGRYPSSLEELVDAGYLRDVPRDPFTKSRDTWELVYEELPEDFEPAETDLAEDGSPGVFDVHSGSDDTALDGTPYSEW